MDWTELFSSLIMGTFFAFFSGGLIGMLSEWYQETSIPYLPPGRPGVTNKIFKFIFYPFFVIDKWLFIEWEYDYKTISYQGPRPFQYRIFFYWIFCVISTYFNFVAKVVAILF